MKRRLPADELGWLGAGASAFGMVLVVGLLAKSLADLYPEADYPFYPGWVPPKDHPEPLEVVRYLLAIAFPLALAALILRRGAPGRGERRFEPLLIAAQVGLAAFVGLMAWAERRSGTFDFGSFEPSLLPDANLIAAPLIGAGLTALALRWDSNALAPLRRAAERIGSAPGWIAVALAALATVLWLLPGVITDEGAGSAGLIPVGHIPIEFDEFAAASNGLTPLVDYVPWYGSLTPIALASWWPLFDLSITSFTATMAVISTAALLAGYAALRNLTQNAWTALALYLPFLAFALQPWDTNGAVREFNGSYYAIMPERYVGPLVVLWLCARHLRRGSPPLWLLFGVAGLAAVNNPEFGAAMLVALVAALIAGREGPLWPWLRGAALEAAAGLAGAIVLACLVILIRSGELPHPDLFAYPSRLARHGYTAATMSLWGLHWVLYVTYGAAVVLAAARVVTGSADRVLTGLLAFAGIFGLLTGAYFAGRSLPWQLWGVFPAWGLAIALLALAGWRALRESEPASVRRIVVAAFTALTGFGLMIASIDRFPLPWQQVDRIGADGTARFDNVEQQRFIEERTEPGEKVLILGWELDHRIAERAGVQNVSPFFGVPALLGPNETERAIDQLEDAGGERAFVRILRPDYTIPSDDLIAAEVDAELRERGYVVVTRDPATGTVEWRRRR